MSAITEVLLWAQRVNGRTKDTAAHQILEIRAEANLEDAQTAFHKIARIAHPDLHRTTLSPEDLEAVTSAYARVASAYQDFRTQRISSRIGRRGDGVTPSGPIPTAQRPAAKAPAASGAATPGTAMSSKALVYYRKAELSLRRGDLKGALLQLKMAIAADPQSSLLRNALAEVQAEVLKTP